VFSPSDRSWCVCSDFDFEFTFFGGPQELISTIQASSEFEGSGHPLNYGHPLWLGDGTAKFAREGSSISMDDCVCADSLKMLDYLHTYVGE
jgi:hypothetical protein